MIQLVIFSLMICSGYLGYYFTKGVYVNTIKYRNARIRVLEEQLDALDKLYGESYNETDMLNSYDTGKINGMEVISGVNYTITSEQWLAKTYPTSDKVTEENQTK